MKSNASNVTCVVPPGMGHFALEAEICRSFSVRTSSRTSMGNWETSTQESAGVLAPATALRSLQRGNYGRAVPQNCELLLKTISK